MITAVWVAVTVPAVAVKLALLAPLDTVTDAGTGGTFSRCYCSRPRPCWQAPSDSR